MRNRLRLAVGAAAVIDQQLEVDSGVTCFTARGPVDPADGPVTRLVFVHPPPPAGPHGGAVLDRLAAIRVIASPILASPLATGVFDDGTWVVEALPTGTTLAERVREMGPLPAQRVIRLVRDSARALSALHRQGLVHGGVIAASVEETGDGFRLHGLARRFDATVSDDLHALGVLAWIALTGREPAPGDRAPRRLRPKIPAQLDRLVATLLEPIPTGRPVSAETILEALDWFPVREPTDLGTLIDGAGRGARPPGERRAAVLLGVIGVLVLLGWLLLRQH